jgi:acyl transferase domain-containing protein/acyl carrier protein
VAYVVTDGEAAGGVTAGGLLGALRRRMPEYMVPSAVVFLDTLPLTPSGKVDRRALPEPEWGGASEEEYVAPQTGIEQEVAGIWQEVLGVDRVGLYDNFFELGGHSLLLIRVHSRLQQVYGDRISMVDLFKYPTVSSLVGYLSDEKTEPIAGVQPEAQVERRRSTAAQRRRRSSEGRRTGEFGNAIAVIGMQCRFPGAKNAEEFWRNLREGRETITFYTDEELRAAGVNPEALKDPNYVKARGMLEDADLFDAAFFGFTPREAEIIDPQHRLFLECAWEILETAGYDSGRYEGRIGVFAGAGMGSNNYLFNLYSNPELISAIGTLQTTYANDKDFLATRVSYKLNLKGPSLTVQTACSTSLVAVHLACRSLLDDESEMALAGGVSVSGRQKAGYLYQDGGTVSPDGHCRVFDARAQGTVFGNGVGIVLLKRLEDALADGDTVHAVIRGSAINNDGAEKVGFTAPSVDGQSSVIAEAQAVAGVEPRSITYVEAHGTGTRMGDPIEMAALTQTFRAATPERGFCAVGSVKSNFGHLDAAAGVAGLMKAVLALKHAEIPPSLHFEQGNPEIDFANSPFFVNTRLRPWEPWQGVRRAGVSAFGIGGTNAHVVLEEAPRVVEQEADAQTPDAVRKRDWEVLLLSAKSAKHLDEMSRRLATHLRENEGAELADVCYTLAVGRHEMSHRRAVVCESREDAVNALGSADPRRRLTSYQEHQDRPVIFMFPGGGAQYAGMGRGLYEGCPEFREEVDRCCEILQPQLGMDLRSVLYPSAEEAETAAEQLRQTATALPALFVTEYATAKQWMAWGVRPWAMIGHSLGEYVAACLAGVFSLEDALRLVAERGRLMQRLPAGAMLSVSLEPKEVEGLLAGSEKVSVAAVNGPSLCVLSGELSAIDELEKVLAARGADFRRLHIDVASHSAIVTPALEEMRRVVRGLTLRTPRMRYVSNVTGTWIRPEEATDPDYWVRHLRQTVRFADGLSELLKEKGSVFLEAGPGQTLSMLVRQQPRDGGTPPVALPSLRHPQDEQADEKFLLNAVGQLWLAGGAVDWDAFYAHERRRRVALPTYCFERSRYWVEPQKGALEAYRSAPGKKQDRADWFYLPSWSRSLASPPRRPEVSAERKERWLFFLDRAGLGEALAARLAGASREAVTVVAGSSFAKLDGNAYRINPAREEDYVSLVAELEKAGALPAVTTHLWNVTAEGEESASVDVLEECLREGYFSLLYLARAWARGRAAEELKVLVVSNRLHDLSGEERECPEKATLLGPCRVIPQEYPNITCRSIDISFAGGTKPTASLLEQLSAELSSDSADTVVAYRGVQRWVQTYEKVRLESDAPPIRELRSDGVYLITGGLGKVGLTIAGHLARAARARLVLLGRTPMPERRDWEHWLETHDPEEKTAAKIKKLLELEELGAEVMLVSADVADEQQMCSALTSIEEFGELRGVFHAAGDMGGDSVFRPIAEIGHEGTEAQIRPKARGLFVLDKLLRDRPLDFMLVVSSNASTLGGLGLTAHAAANLYAEAFASAAAKTRPYPLITTNWDAWPAAERVPTEGMRTSADEFALSPVESLDALMRLLRQATSGRLIVSAGDLSARRDIWVGRAGAPSAEGAQVPDAAHERPEMANDYVAPRDEVEQTIAGAWQYLLGIDRIGIYDSFFELGGHSLLATRLLSRIRDMYRVEVPMRRLFESPEVAGLAEAVKELLAAKGEDGDAAPTPSPGIERAPRVARRLSRAPLG